MTTERWVITRNANKFNYSKIGLLDWIEKIKIFKNKNEMKFNHSDLRIHIRNERLKVNWKKMCYSLRKTTRNNKNKDTT